MFPSSLTCLVLVPSCSAVLAVRRLGPRYIPCRCRKNRGIFTLCDMPGIRAWSSSTTTLTRVSGRKKTIFQMRSIWKWAGGIVIFIKRRGPAGDPPAGSRQITGKCVVRDRAAYRCDALFSLCGYSRNSPLTPGSGGVGTLYPCHVQTGCQRPDDPPWAWPQSSAQHVLSGRGRL